MSIPLLAHSAQRPATLEHENAPSRPGKNPGDNQNVPYPENPILASPAAPSNIHWGAPTYGPALESQNVAPSAPLPSRDEENAALKLLSLVSFPHPEATGFSL